MGRRAYIGTLLCGVGASLLASAPADAQSIQQDKVSATEKGSLVIFSKIELRWDDLGFVTQDTFISLTNDYPGEVKVQFYLIHGDPPLPADGAERSHPGWVSSDFVITLTGDQPTYWSALTGQPATGGAGVFTALDPGSPPGRPNPEGGRMLRGYLIGWAVDNTGCQIRWNHLKGEGTIVNYLEGAAWEYNTWNYAAVTGAQGDPVGTCGLLQLDGSLYSQSFEQLLMNFQAVGSSAWSGPRLVMSDTDLTLFPVSVDLREETCGPYTTKADFTVWNMNEVKFSGTRRCITCWDQTLLSNYGIPNNFLLVNLQTDHGKARIDGVASQVCDVDVDPTDGCFPFGMNRVNCVRTVPGGCADGPSSHPDDVVSTNQALLGVVARILTFDAGMPSADHAYAGTNLVGMGFDDYAKVRYDPTPPPPESPEGQVQDPVNEWLQILDDEVAGRPNLGRTFSK